MKNQNSIKYHLSPSRKLSLPKRFDRSRSLVMAGVLVVTGVVAAMILAAGTPVALETESGTLSGPASLVSSSSASGGSAVKFGSATTSGTLTLDAVADTYVATDAVNTNYGASTNLNVSLNTYHPLIRFTVAGLPAGAQITGVTFRAYSTSAAPGSIVVHPASDTWAENTVTSSTQPAWDATQLGTSATLTAGAYAEVTLPVSAVPSAGDVSFGLNTTQGILGTLASRETTTKPQLIITYAGSGSPTPTPTTTTTSTPTPTPTPTPTGMVPVGVPGNWTLAFDDEFNGTSLDTSRWSNMEGHSMNNVTTHASNIAVTGGNLVLTLASSTSGAFVSSNKADGAGANGYLVPVGAYAEARINFAGDGSKLYNWPAWWTSGANWPAGGENDIAEVLSGQLTVNYHSPSGSHNQGAVPGYWGGAFHVYGLYRHANSADVYWDGVKVKSYATDDNGIGQCLLLNVGASGTGVYGASSAMKVDYVRVWQ